MNSASGRDGIRLPNISDIWSSNVVNTPMLVGHGNIRGSVVGYDDRKRTAAEMDEMRRLLAQSIEEGAIGFSTGLIYPARDLFRNRGTGQLAKMLKDRSLIYASHMRSEGSRLIDAVRETIRIGREAGVKIQVSHIKTAGQQNWGKAGEVVSLLTEAIGGWLRSRATVTRIRHRARTLTPCFQHGHTREGTKRNSGGSGTRKKGRTSPES